MTAHTPPLDIKKLLSAIPGIGGGSNASSSTSSSAVSVNPIISVVTGGGSPQLSSSGSASSSPSSSAEARPISRAGYGYGGGVLPLEQAGDLPGELGGSGAQGADDGPDFMTLALMAGGAVAAYFALDS